jgi:DNA-binding transcriptional regulator YiaG
MRAAATPFASKTEIEERSMSKAGTDFAATTNGRRLTPAEKRQLEKEWNERLAAEGLHELHTGPPCHGKEPRTELTVQEEFVADVVGAPVAFRPIEGSRGGWRTRQVSEGTERADDAVALIEEFTGRPIQKLRSALRARLRNEEQADDRALLAKAVAQIREERRASRKALATALDCTTKTVDNLARDGRAEVTA